MATIGYLFIKLRQQATIENKKSANRLQVDAHYCTPLGIRTLDPLIKSQLLYQLS